jgi:hypothetical protein
MEDSSLFYNLYQSSAFFNKLRNYNAVIALIACRGLFFPIKLQIADCTSYLKLISRGLQKLLIGTYFLAV